MATPSRGTRRKPRAKNDKPRVRRAAAAPASDVRSDNRREALLDAAARLFGSRGYAATSTRDIAAEVGILAGSIYYHFPSKEALALAVHERGVNSILSAVQVAIADGTQDPWERLEAACVAHLDALLNGGSYAQVVTPNFARALPAAFVSTLIRQRDTYERLFVDLVDALPLPRGTNRRYLRLALLGSLNWALTWYRPGGDSPKVIARRIVDLYRQPLDTRR